MMRPTQQPTNTPTTMTTPAIFNFTVKKEEKSITVERSFNAPLNTVWDAWTRADILCKWWAPQPWTCVVKSMDFREGGRWLYYMQGPEGERHWSFFEYEKIQPKSSFAGRDGFCDEHGTVNMQMPRMQWESRFSTADGGTLVRTQLRFESAEHLEQIVAMGFKEGFAQGLQQLEELLANTK